MNRSRVLSTMMPPITEIEGTWEEILQYGNSLTGKRVKLILLDENLPAAPTAIFDRAALLKLPKAERHRILAERAEAMAAEYEIDRDWAEFLGGDFIEY